MPEPDRLVSPQPQSEKSALWNEAPGWRNLTVAAVMLTASAIALPLMPQSPAAPESAQQPDVCRLGLPTVPGPSYPGTVLSFVDPATSMAQIKMIQAQAGGQIDAAYLDKQRVSARTGDGSSRFYFVPPNLEVHVGDRVILQGWYRNESLPCNYVPNVVIANQGPAANAMKAPPRDNAGRN